MVQHEKVYKSDFAEVERLDNATTIRKNELLLSGKSFGLSGEDIDELETLRYQDQQLTACMDAADKFAVESALLEQNISNITSTRKRLAEIDTTDSLTGTVTAHDVETPAKKGGKALHNDSSLKRIRYRLDELIGHQSKLANLRGLQRQIDGYESEIALAIKPLNLVADNSSADTDISALKIPFEKTIRDYETQWSEQSKAIKQIQEQQEDLIDEATQIQLGIDSTRENADLPDTATLRHNRQQRDMLYENLKAGDVISDQNYRLSVQRSDELADRLIASAESVVMLQQKQLELNRVDARKKTLQEDLEEHSEILGSSRKAWLKEWGLPSDAVRTPAEMLEWREQWEKVCSLQSSQAKARAELHSDRSTVIATIKQLRELLPTLKGLSGSADLELESADLASLAETASLVREEVSDSLREVDERSGASANSDKLKARYSEELEKQQQEYSSLKSRTLSALSQLVSNYSAVGIDVNPALDTRYLISEPGSKAAADVTSRASGASGLTVFSAREHLQARMDLVALYDQFLQSGSELEEKRKSVQKFTAEVEKISIEMGIKGSVEAAVFELGKSLNVNQKNTVLLDSLHEQLTSLESSLLHTTTERNNAEHEYLQLLEALGLDESTDLLTLVPTIERYEELEKHIEATRRSLATHAGSQTTEEFIAEVGERDLDELRAEKTSLEQQRSAVAQQRDELIEQRTRLNAELRAMDENTGEAADTQQRLNQAEATQQRFAVEYITLKLAAKVLRSSVEDYREANRGPLFDEASVLFRRLTGDSFLRINLDYSAENRILIKGQRADGKNLGVEQMSDGTRDQLYLAMRLSALKLHLGNNEPMPLVVDDLLITFDDTRTASALEVLAEIATQTQVLIFTHHERVMKIGVERFDAEGSSFNNLFIKKPQPVTEKSAVSVV